MAEKVKKPRVQIGDATGSWRCVINCDDLNHKDVRHIHRAIDVAVRNKRQERRQQRRQTQINTRETIEAAVLDNAATLSAEENVAAKIEAEQLRTSEAEAIAAAELERSAESKAESEKQSQDASTEANTETE